MPLISLWESNPNAVTQLNIEQTVATAGDGKLRDDSVCSNEFRQYLAQVASDKLAEFAEHCLAHSFPKSGLVLQDIVNEFGRRLDYQVQNGRYQGVIGGIGYDGIWSSPEGNEFVVEIKTTDAYRISLDTIATYRDRLHGAGKLKQNSSVLLVVGREDTGELEAQVRGSRHAWEMRLISIDALLTLVKLKESTEAGVTGTKIRSILIPMEYTRLDTLINVKCLSQIRLYLESNNCLACSEANGSKAWISKYSLFQSWYLCSRQLKMWKSQSVAKNRLIQKMKGMMSRRTLVGNRQTHNRYKQSAIRFWRH